MSNMNITKSKFMEYIRCNRFPALNNIHKRRDLDDALMDRYYDLLDSLENTNDSVYEEDFLEPDLTHEERLKVLVCHEFHHAVQIYCNLSIRLHWPYNPGRKKFGFALFHFYQHLWNLENRRLPPRGQLR